MPTDDSYEVHAHYNLSHMSAEWQHPFINVFKMCDVESWKHISKDGNVVAMLVRRAPWPGCTS